MSNLTGAMARRIAALETDRPERGWSEVFDAMSDAELFRLEGLVEKLEPDPGGVWPSLAPEDQAFLREVEGRWDHRSDAATAGTAGSTGSREAGTVATPEGMARDQTDANRAGRDRAHGVGYGFQ